MADTLQQTHHHFSSSESRFITTVQDKGVSLSAPVDVSVPQSPSGIRSGHLNLDTFSPVNQNGSFAFDRVLRSGEVQKRTKKTKQWKSFFLVLRPNLLSLYKTSTEERLLKQISLSDLTAVAYLKDPKGRRQHLIGLFSPSRNFHLQAKSDADARAWVELIKHEARIDEEEQEVYLGSPTAAEGHKIHTDHDQFEHERLGSSSPEPFEAHHSTTREGIRIPGIRHLSAHELEYSGDDLAPYSDFSDTPSHTYAQSLGSFINPKQRRISRHNPPYPTPQQHPTARNASQASGIHVEQDEERVIWNGYLLCLKSKGGVKQWKRLWVVLRPKNLACYKNEEEYAARLIVPLANIISAVEIDPISRSKSHCMQIIGEEQSYRFCAPSEDALAEWLGALKSQLARRKEVIARKNVV